MTLERAMLRHLTILLLSGFINILQGTLKKLESRDER